MDTRPIAIRGTGVHRGRAPVRWAWGISLGLALLGGTAEWAADRGPPAQSPTATDLRTAPPADGGPDQRT